MTKLEIRPGACWLVVAVTAKVDANKKVKILVKAECEEVKKFVQEIECLSVEDILGYPFAEDKVYQAAKKTIRHASCPVPCGIIKAAEAELGLAVKQDVLIHFLHE